MAHFPETKNNVVEGVGNEVLLGIGVISMVLCFCTIILLIHIKKTRNTNIHPEEFEHVQQARERLGLEISQNPDDSSTDREREVPRRINEGEPCPICLIQPRLLVITNCGHGFCGLCLIAYWQTRSYRVMACPVCRQQVSMIFTGFPAETATEEASNVRNSVNRYNRLFSNEPRTFMEYIQDLPTLIQQLFHEFFSVNGLVTVLRIRVVVCFFAAILYLLLPVDILPEAVFGFLGFFDDIVVFGLLILYVSEIYRNFVAQRAAEAAL